MVNSKVISDAFLKMLATPVFTVHIALRVQGANRAYRTKTIKTYSDAATAPKYPDDSHRDIAESIANMFMVNGVNVSKIFASPETGFIEIELNPLMSAQPMFNNWYTSMHVGHALETITLGIEHEVMTPRLQPRTDFEWVDAFGMGTARVRIFAGTAFGTRLQSFPDMYNLHIIKNPKNLEGTFGVAFTGAIERVVFPDYRDNSVAIPEEVIAIPLSRFEALAKKYGWGDVNYSFDSNVLVTERPA